MPAEKQRRRGEAAARQPATPAKRGRLRGSRQRAPTAAARPGPTSAPTWSAREVRSRSWLPCAASPPASWRRSSRAASGCGTSSGRTACRGRLASGDAIGSAPFGGAKLHVPTDHATSSTNTSAYSKLYALPTTQLAVTTRKPVCSVAEPGFMFHLRKARSAMASGSRPWIPPSPELRWPPPCRPRQRSARSSGPGPAYGRRPTTCHSPSSRVAPSRQGQRPGKAEGVGGRGAGAEAGGEGLTAGAEGAATVAGAVGVAGGVGEARPRS
eukprot:COSAG04_NODE_9144_length_894_cov_0.811321_1_plen_268_part_01